MKFITAIAGAFKALGEALKALPPIVLAAGLIALLLMNFMSWGTGRRGGFRRGERVTAKRVTKLMRIECRSGRQVDPDSDLPPQVRVRIFRPVTWPIFRPRLTSQEMVRTIYEDCNDELPTFRLPQELEPEPEPVEPVSHSTDPEPHPAKRSTDSNPRSAAGPAPCEFQYAWNR